VALSRQVRLLESGMNDLRGLESVENAFLVQICIMTIPVYSTWTKSSNSLDTPWQVLTSFKGC
jgi:hypothetical protein